ncbi:UDP-galactose-4-epimerase [Escherichia coli]|nr:UDP-galactose-4-epimerase [Escherichia coli]
MRAANVKNFIFSSSATVYGDQPKIPYVESFPTGTPQSPYGKSKLMVEQILTDLQKAQPDWSIALLRYFTRLARIRRAIWAKIRKAFRIT